MSAYNQHNPFKKYLNRFMISSLGFWKEIYKKIMTMDIYERVFVVSLLVFSVLIIISPLMILSPNDDAAFTAEYIFLIGKVQFLKTALVMLVWLFLTITWHLSTQMRSYIVEYVGFNNNLYLFSFFLLFSMLASFMSLGEMNNILSDYTTMLRMHSMYYVLQIILIVLVGYCIYMLLYQSQSWFKWTIVWYQQKSSWSKHQDDDMQWLFDNLKDS